MLAPFAAVLLGFTAPGANVPQDAASTPVVLATLSSEDCVSVHADGEPWEECGFQDFALNATGRRVLTVSAKGVVQLWDDAGHEIARFTGSDERTGASGYPSAEVAIVDGIGVAVVHSNQVIVIDLARGSEIAREVFGGMTVGNLRVAEGHLFAEVQDRRWRPSHGEISLTTGKVIPAAAVQVAPRKPAWIPALLPYRCRDARSFRIRCQFSEDEQRWLVPYDVFEGRETAAGSLGLKLYDVGFDVR